MIRMERVLAVRTLVETTITDAIGNDDEATSYASAKAELVERIVCEALGVDWDLYCWIVADLQRKFDDSLQQERK